MTQAFLCKKSVSDFYVTVAVEKYISKNHNSCFKKNCEIISYRTITISIKCSNPSRYYLKTDN